MKKGKKITYKGNGSEIWYFNERGELENDKGGWIYFRPFIETLLEAKGFKICQESILDKQEKEYLEAVLRPFKNRVRYIEKISSPTSNYVYEFIVIGVQTSESYDEIIFPYFKTGTKYKGMNLYKGYTLKELGLFEGE